MQIDIDKRIWITSSVNQMTADGHFSPMMTVFPNRLKDYYLYWSTQ